MWKLIPGYKVPYRINEQGEVQGCRAGKWKTKQVQLHLHQTSATVCLTGLDGKPLRRTVGSLMADAFLGGQKPGYVVIHKNGLRCDNSLENLRLVPKKGGSLGGGGLNRKCLAAIGRRGEIVKLYPSITAAIRGEHISESTIRWSRQNGKAGYVAKTGRRYEVTES